MHKGSDITPDIISLISWIVTLKKKKSDAWYSEYTICSLDVEIGKSRIVPVIIDWVLFRNNKSLLCQVRHTEENQKAI